MPFLHLLDVFGVGDVFDWSDERQIGSLPINLMPQREG